MNTFYKFVLIVFVGIELICTRATAYCPTSNYPGVQFTDIVVFSASFAVDSLANPISQASPASGLAANPLGNSASAGRNSNGLVYHEVLAFGDNVMPNYLNPVGGCTGPLVNASKIWNFALNAASCDPTIFGSTDSGNSIRAQVSKAISQVVSNPNSTLYHFLVSTTDITSATPTNIPSIASCYANSINRIVQALGAYYFLLGNAYAYDYAPEIVGYTQKATLVSNLFNLNAQLASIPANFSKTSPATKIWMLDVYHLYANILLSNASIYYGVNADIVTPVSHVFGQANLTPDSYFWYDGHHPSRATHRYIAQAMYNTLLAAPASTLATITTQSGVNALSVSTGYLTPSFSSSTLSYTLHGIKKPGSSVVMNYNPGTSPSVYWGSCSNSTCETKLTTNVLCFQTFANPCPNGTFTITGVDVNQYFYLTSNSVTLVISTPPAVAALKGDPHFRGFLDQDYTITGTPGSVYSILSSADLSYNAKFIWYGDKYHGLDPLSNKGYDTNVTYIGEVGIRVRNPISKVEYRLDVSVVPRIVPGVSNNLLLNINGDNVTINQLNNVTVKACGGRCVIQQFGANKISIALNDLYTISFEAKQTKDKYFFIDEEVVVEDWNKLIQSSPHGLLGQTWRNKQQMHHARDERWSGHKAGVDFMFKSADFLDGDLQDYVIKEHHVYGIDFTFNQYRL